MKPDKPLTIDYVVNKDLCHGCGVCEDVCPKKSIAFKEMRYLNIPQINSKTCINDRGCDLCFRACPGHGFDVVKDLVSYDSNETGKEDQYIGTYINCYTGWSKEDNIRYHSASGGVLSQLLIYLIETGVVQGAVVTKFSEKNPLRTSSFIATNREEILAAKSSKYCPVSLNGVASKVKEFSGQVVVVGLPCHIAGMRKLVKIDKRFGKKVIGFFAIYCSSTRNYNAMNYLLKKRGIDNGDVKSFTFRDDGCLGSMKITTANTIYKEKYTEYYGRLKSYFKPRRCLLCADHYGMFADVSFGDIHIAPYFNEIGVNSVIVRNKLYDKYIKKATDDGHLDITEIESDVINESQKMMIKNRDIIVPFNLFFERLLGRGVPNDTYYNPKSIKPKGLYYWLSFSVQRVVGRWL